jgi:peroxiredoxin
MNDFSHRNVKINNIQMKKISLFFVCAFLITTMSNAKDPYKPGDNASDFNLRNVDGKMVTLSGLGDVKGYIVVFMCNTCPTVKQYEQRIIDLHNEFSGKGYPVVAVNSNDKSVSPGDSFEEMQRTAKAKGYKFDYLYDESQDVAKKYGATNTPHVYVLSKDEGNLKVEYVGAIDNNVEDGSKADKHYVQDAVKALLKGEEVQQAGTKAIGCGIKWKKS